MKWPEAQIIEAGDFPSAWIKAQTQPDLCIADLVMPGASPLEGIQGIMSAAPKTPILIVTGTEDDNLLLTLLRSGVSGFAPKSASGAIIEAAINLILAGGRYLPPRLADIAAARIDAQFQAPRNQTMASNQDTAPDGTIFAQGHSQHHVSHGAAGQTTLLDLTSLTSRQVDVLRLVSDGHSNKEIARLLGVAPSTVKTHLEKPSRHPGRIQPHRGLIEGPSAQDHLTFDFRELSQARPTSNTAGRPGMMIMASVTREKLALTQAVLPIR